MWNKNRKGEEQHLLHSNKSKTQGLFCMCSPDKRHLSLCCGLGRGWSKSSNLHLPHAWENSCAKKNLRIYCRRSSSGGWIEPTLLWIAGVCARSMQCTNNNNLQFPHMKKQTCRSFHKKRCIAAKASSLGGWSPLGGVTDRERDTPEIRCLE